MMEALKEALKLNLGARDRPIPGFKSVDCEAHPGVDFVRDASDLSIFEDGSVVEIYASHILEHFPHTNTLAVLKEWHRVLEPGGILYVAVPDFKKVLEQYEEYGLTDWHINWIFGDQEYKTAFHYTAFDFKRLSDLLHDAGFSESSQVEFFPIEGLNDCSMLVNTLTREPVSLNVIAVK